MFESAIFKIHFHDKLYFKSQTIIHEKLEKLLKMNYMSNNCHEIGETESPPIMSIYKVSGFRTGTQVHLWLIHVNVWKKLPQYCTVISL